MVVFNPLFYNNNANDEVVIPLPKPEITPPVTKIYFVILIKKS